MEGLLCQRRIGFNCPEMSRAVTDLKNLSLVPVKVAKSHRIAVGVLVPHPFVLIVLSWC